MKIRFSKLSKHDYDISILYYKKESDSLSERFKSDIKESIKRIETFPNLYPKINDRVQKCVLSKFPYTIYYTIKDESIYILAIANHYKNPEEYNERFS
jgi:hypothetical protein